MLGAQHKWRGRGGGSPTNIWNIASFVGLNKYILNNVLRFCKWSVQGKVIHQSPCMRTTDRHYTNVSFTLQYTYYYYAIEYIQYSLYNHNINIGIVCSLNHGDPSGSSAGHWVTYISRHGQCTAVVETGLELIKCHFQEPIHLTV